MIPTTQEEMQAFYAMALPGFLEYLRSHQTAIEQVELASTRQGIVSFPATQSLGGVLKTVRVPLSMLTADIDAAEEEARAMSLYAKNQGDYAKAQGDRVDGALDDLDEEIRLTNQAAANAVNAAGEAQGAASLADEARLTARDMMTLFSASEAEREAMWEEMMRHPMLEGENHNWWAWSLETHSWYDTGIIAGGSILYPIFEQDVEDGGLYMTYASQLEAARFYQDESDGALYFYPSGNAPSVQQSGNQ